MDLQFSREDETFREEVRAFLQDNLPPRLSEKVRTGKRLTKQDMEEWHAILNGRGWLANHWPAEYGGTGWSVTQKYIFEVEVALANAPRIVPFGVSMLGPVLIKYGSEEQKRYWLPRILDGSDWWCQGYSEPGAGSDLASVKTTAVRDGDHYIVNGQKTWTTLGQYANMIFCLVRTSSSGKRQEGISFLLVDMATPGIEIRPITLLDGEQEVNEVFFTDVRVPVANLVGEENKGWTYAKFLLTYERTNIAGVGGSMAAFEQLRQIAETQRKGGLPLAEDPLFAARLARLEIELENMKTTNLRVVAAAGHGAAPVAESSMLKIRGTEIRQEIDALARRALGPYAQPFVAEALEEGFNGEPVGPGYAASVTPRYLNDRKLSIFGGSNEVQREIITKAILEL
ncbi:pimeloyl-CoA dehydrogenase large subunit [Sphingopyxis sp. Root214]|uniref:acyl-CoA dehydrogenase family protein n=1 Tax=unclassified Sphingopyxis TaxID=2614943 RepID=UPI0006FF6770|nr:MULTISPECIES: acyl-CoA dehydrogenase family protein [unclassified Sphingopyxis]KQZ73819.1 pimeloyl-CoA dehydrogenase large subunit [Sphingopyxis sp. Root154]KRC07960.1 pimeloyl-CoA dehydrogenase large subunit [Sphingopyxis sp. Root214]